MILNYLKIAWRNIIRNKLLTFINVGGLAVGIATCLLIMQYVQFERSYDQFLDNKNDIFRVHWNFYQNGDLSLALPKAAGGAGPRMLAEIPEVVAQTRMYKTFSPVNISYADRAFNESKVLFASADFFKVLSFPFVHGNKQEALDGPNKIVLSRSASARYFPGVKDPTGEMLRLKEGNVWDLNLLVTGLMDDLPANTHLEADVVISFDTFLQYNRHADNTIHWVNFYTYLLTEPGTTKEQLDAKFADWLANQQEFVNWREEDRPRVLAQPLTDIHLHSNLTQEMKANGDASVVAILLAAALMILVIAWLNYINLTTAKGLERAKEVGIKKVIGASRTQLIGQFLLEALLINCVSLVIAFTLYQFGQPLVHSLLPVQPDWRILFEGALFWPVAAILCGGALISGYYPALIISAYKPVSILKGRASHSADGYLLRKIMVSLQFVLSLALLIATFTVKDQVFYMLNQDLGMNMDQVVVAQAPKAYSTNHQERSRLFREEILSLPGVAAASQSRMLPGEELFYGRAFQMEGEKGNNNNYGQATVDSHFLSLLEIEFIGGRNFEVDLVTDQSSVILNESAVSLLEFASPEEALGKKIFFIDDDFGWWTIIGVVKNHHHYALSREQEAIIYYQTDQEPTYFTFKIGAADAHATIAHVQQRYEEFFPGNPFEYHFMDEQFNRQYLADKQMISVFSGFSLVAAIIACLGLFGLASFEALQRTKEIGIRKVLGASFSSIALLFSGKFFKLLFASAFICLPLCYYLMDSWLDNYPYRMSLGWQEFVWPVAILAGISMITLLYHTLKTVRVNPVEALRSE